jgi:hypothetical protein
MISHLWLQAPAAPVTFDPRRTQKKEGVGPVLKLISS